MSLKIRKEVNQNQEKIEKAAQYISKVKKGINKQQQIIADSREFIKEKHKDEQDLKSVSYNPSGAQIQVASFYDPKEGKLTEIEASSLSLHKCAQESKHFRKELNKAQSNFEFAKENVA